ncbi:MAG: Hsp70 family protein, partial [Clostridiales bacterium]|nr:Hsp70 family protein [Clostridiales bacterium]
VTFDIDVNGIVNVTAQDKGTGKSQNITITASTNMSKEDIDKAVREAEQFAAEDAKRKEDVDARNQADQLLYQCDQTVSELGDKISEGEKSQIEAGKAKLQDAMKGTDTAAIKAATDELTKVFYDISAKLYQQAGGDPNAAGAGYNPNAGAGYDPNAGQSGNNGGNGDDYYDADYEVVDDDK